MTVDTDLTHLDAQDRPRMVDVGDKPLSCRIALAQGRIALQPATVARIEAGEIRKGNVLLVAELAGVQAAKATSNLIPLCHPLLPSQIDVKATLETDGVRVDATVKCIGQTGAEMESLTAVSIALLTIYDMCKAVDKTMEIHHVRLLSKTKEQV